MKKKCYVEKIKTNLWMLIRIDEKGFVTFSDGHQFGLNSIQTILKGDSSQIKKLFFLILSKWKMHVKQTINLFFPL